MPLRLYRRTVRGHWYIRGTVRGRRVFETTGTADPKAAEAARAKREAELFEESVFGARAVVSFQRCALSYLEFEQRDERTKAHVAKLVAHFGATKLSAIDQHAADAAVTAIVGAKASPATKIRVVYTPLTAILNHGWARKWCDKPVFSRPSVPKPTTRFLMPFEALVLVGAAAKHLQPLLLFLLCTGARLSEALDLDWADVDLGAARCRFRDTKNGTDRIAAMPPAAVTALANLPGRAGVVFRRDDGEPYASKERLEGGQIKRAWRTACKRAGVDGATPHDLRHTWASWFYALTKDLLLLKHEGGWKSSAMVERYTHLLPSELVPGIAKVWGPTHPRIGAISVQAGPVESKSA